MSLPEGYTLDRKDPDIWWLRDPNGEPVAAFIAGAPDSEIEDAARRHERGESLWEMAVAVLVGVTVGAALGWGFGLQGPLW